uniref:Subtilisin-like protease n=1 Tax=Oryza rufipogon TaxID=4529 RepID=A0A0E0NCU6_ORYRU
MGEKKHDDPFVVTASHHDMLASVLGSKDEAMRSIVYSYKHGFSGFAAMLTESQAEEIAGNVNPNIYHQAHTTRSWDFLGLNYYEQSGLLKKANYGEDVIVGVIDSGIWPESESFNDSGYSSVPTRWKGKCQTGMAFNATSCNRKIIGARWYSGGIQDESLKGEYLSPRDANGHGTHTASTIVGGQVWNASHKRGGLAAGSAHGGAPRARVAVYKACWGAAGGGISCSNAAVLAAIDDAINDGVDVLSLSIGGPVEYLSSRHAVARGIPVVFSAGNDGPTPQTVGSTLPWVITVAASTIDRTFPTVISLGNKEKLVGQSLYYKATAKSGKFEMLVDGGFSCDKETLALINVTGKIVLCSAPLQAKLNPPRLMLPAIIGDVANAGAAGLIFAQYTVNILEDLDACNGSMPCVLVDYEIANRIRSYVASTRMPVVEVSPAMTVVGSGVLSPRVAAFSSRGPSTLFPGILKPDIAAPGVSILAALGDSYEFMSGTSMACPHVSAVVALLKMVHPDWSPAMIKSAIVTTDPREYAKFYNCSINPKDECKSYMRQLYQLNLPSIVVPDLKYSVTVWRTIINVGVAEATYHAMLEAPVGMTMSVEPSVIKFTNGGSRSVTFKVTFTTRQRVQGGYTFGSLTWQDGITHSVRIPIALYIVYMGEKKHDDPSVVTASHHDTLTSVLGSKDGAMKSIVYSYKHGFSGFAAMLTESQAEELARLPEVISVKPNTYHQAQTTRSWDFLGLNYNEQSGLLKKAKNGEDVIVGVIDSGIWPESRSFDDNGYSPVPARWKGKCQTGAAFNATTGCNRKIIGVRWYSGGIPDENLKGEYMSARDLGGHGTHVASTIVGGQVRNVSHRQGGALAAGTARGGAPRARVAVYKVCWGLRAQCGGAAILAAIDDAMNDGVDVLSLSIGGAGEHYETLHAVARGIPVVFGGGNDGPTPQIVRNTVPWVITVAASTIDRAFPTVISLGNNKKFVGQSLYYNATASSTKFQMLVDGSSCDTQTLASINITSKVVLCSPPSLMPPRLSLGDIIGRVIKAGANGLIFVQYSVSNALDFLNACSRASVPCVLVDYEITRRIESYMTSTSTPMVKVSSAMTVVGSGVLSPRIAAFSSRGPSSLFPGILKPDIAAPGVSILAAVGDSYELKSGTSMACPHVSAVVALLKMVHPDWSPAMIKSAIVTTASVTDRFGMPIQAEAVPRKVADPFDFGGGHIEPNKAIDPGLVYDIDPSHYTKFFNCTLPEAEDDCESYMEQIYQLNLPSIAVPNLKDSVTVWRTVTNVGEAEATYHAALEAPVGMTMSVEPSVITFTRGGSRSVTFKVTFTTTQRVQGGYTFGSLTWLDGNTHSLYIVYMGEKKHDDPSVVTASHHDALTSVFGSKDEAMKSIVYSYKHGFSGFAAMLTESQADELARTISQLQRNKEQQQLSYACLWVQESLATVNVTGKIVLCYAPLEAAATSSPNPAFGTAAIGIAKGGAKGLIFAHQRTNIFDDLENCNKILPAGCMMVDFEIAAIIASYLNSTRKTVAKISRAVTVVGNGVLAPRVAAFSSRGPSIDFPGILKPDVAAPGVSILAAVGDSYKFMSGTSMACPHVSAVAALLKSVHPDWSPATGGETLCSPASVTDRFGMPIQAEGVPRKVADPFDFGGGHIDPDKSVDPGLVYDIDPKEYTKFFNCTLGPKEDCESYVGQLYQLNLPSIAVPDLKDSITV